MFMKIIKSILYSLFAFLVLASCQPEVDKFEITEFEATGDVSDALSLIQNQNSSHTISLENDMTLAIDRLLFTFPADVFVDGNNNIVTNEIELKTIILNKQRDLLKYDVSSEDVNHVLLETELAFSIAAFQNGNRLSINPTSNGITVQVFDDAPRQQAMYKIENSNQDDLWSINATEVSSGELFVEYNGGGLDTTGYEFILKDLAWISLQSEMDHSNFTSICLKLLDSNTPANTRAFLLYDDFNTCQRLNLSAKGECALTVVPAGIEGSIVVLAHKGLDRLELALKREFVDNTIRDVEIEPIRILPDEFISVVEGL